jgi:hypothetical protein
MARAAGAQSRSDEHFLVQYIPEAVPRQGIDKPLDEPHVEVMPGPLDWQNVPVHAELHSLPRLGPVPESDPGPPSRPAIRCPLLQAAQATAAMMSRTNNLQFLM